MFISLVFVVAASVMMDGPPVTWEIPRPVADQWNDTHLSAIGEPRPLADNIWDLVEYREEVRPDPVEPTESTVSVATPPSDNGQYSGMGSDVEQWRGLVAAYFPAGDVDLVLAVMRCESGGNPWADNPYSSATGLMQLLASTWGPAYGYTTAQLFDPAINLLVASYLWADGKGIGHWNASRHCWG